MKRYLLLILTLAACIPSTRPATPAEASLTAEGGVLSLTTAKPLSYASARVLGDVASRYCAAGVTELEVPCEADANGVVALELPPGAYGLMVDLGSYTGPVNGFADVVTEGSREALRVELKAAGER